MIPGKVLFLTRDFYFRLLAATNPMLMEDKPLLRLVSCCFSCDGCIFFKKYHY